MFIESIKNQKIKDIKKLNQKKYRDKSNLFIIEGEHLVLEAYKNNVLDEVLISVGYDIDINVTKTFVPSSVLSYITELENAPKVIGICKKIENKHIGNKILILDRIQDPGNLGTIIRSSVAFNIDTIVLSEDSVDLYNSKVLRATQGLIFSMNIIERKLIDFIEELKCNDYKIYGTSVKNGKVLKNIENSEKFAIIMGNEGKGVDSNILDMCDEYIYIPMNSKCESLNVAVATSIILYELSR